MSDVDVDFWRMLELPCSTCVRPGYNLKTSMEIYQTGIRRHPPVRIESEGFGTR